MSDRPVGDDIDREMRTVMADLADAAPPAPDYELISSPAYVTDNGEVSEMRRTRWIVAGAAAAAVLVLVIVGVAVANTNDDEASETATEAATEVPANTNDDEASEAAAEVPASDLELATQFLTDLHGLDTEAAVAVMDSDAIVNYLAARGTDDIAGLQGVMAARDWVFTAENCAETTDAAASSAGESETRVACDVTFEDALSKAAGVEPFLGSVAEVWIEDGTVALLRLTFRWQRHVPEVFGAFEAWLADTHPEDERAMWGPERNHPAVTPESVALWEEYTAEYIAERYG